MKLHFPRHLFLAVCGILLAVSLRAQDLILLGKAQKFRQTGATTLVADTTAPFTFGASSTRSGFSITTPRGATFVFTYSPGDENYGVHRTFATKAALDAEFPNGAYTFTGPGVSFTVTLAGDLYPAVPQIVGGNWNAGGALLLTANTATTLNFNPFPSYATAGTMGHVYAEFNSNDSLSNQVVSKPVAGVPINVAPQALASLPVPANLLPNNFGCTGELAYDTFTVVDTTTLPGAAIGAFYNSGTTYNAASLASGTGGNPPSITTQPTNRSVALGGTVTLPIAVTTGNVAGQGAFYDWRHNGETVHTDGTDPKYSMAANGTLTIKNATPAEAGNYAVRVGNTGGSVSSNVAVVTVTALATPPANQSAAVGQSVTLTTAAAAGTTPVLQWTKNGANLTGSTNASLTLNALQPSSAGIYALNVTALSTTLLSPGAIVGLTSAVKLEGPGTEFPDIVHPGTGNTYDQILLQGNAASITSDFVAPGSAVNQITRISFIDLSDDIVQVEFSGPGTLTLVLDSVSGPATPAKYIQAVAYMKGHAGIVVTGATENTHLSVFSVGTLVNANPALYRTDVTYDGFADIAFVAIASANGKFGGLRTANASYFATQGYTGVYAPGVEFTGPVFVGDINAADNATPVLIIGAGADTRITGGDLQQANNRAVQVSGLAQLKFAAGSNSHGVGQMAKNNAARLEQNGVDVTAQIVVNPAP
jgi:hypothetical protein